MKLLKHIPTFPLIFMLALTGTFAYLHWHKRAIFAETEAERDKTTTSHGRTRGGHGIYRTHYHK
ncbi:MAG: hypothetical protein IT244_04320 [Bacteroidia bacterium]|nr:hypothetical protein [Bacteroidia bacterium]